ncbi:MAG TPA: carboxypeptidase regulatory-like domain-containing protein, partial [Blastocatellia bacterium]
IFIDEIDAVRSLPFPTDEFFAGIRELYNRRAEDRELERLVFCLLGVATPSNLIQDTRTTPFNIGRRIELNDFTEQEAAILARGLGADDEAGRKMLRRVLYWTGGHPYLTQRVCQSVAEDESAADAKGVDRVCQSLFFSSRARERDDNLLFVRQRLLRSEIDVAALLDIYSRVRRRKRVRDDETNTLISVLRLSGITKAVDGRLQVRNRIYNRVFDNEWILANMPDAELQRQRMAYLRGLLRAAGIATVVVILMLLLLFTTFEQKRVAEGEKARAQEALGQAEEATRLANERAAEAERQRELTLQAQSMAASNLSQAEQERLRANLMTWEMIKEDSNPQTFRAFLEVSPTKDLASKAKARLRTISASQSVPATGVIRGKLYDASTNEPVSGATVTIKNSENESSAVSNVDGEFLLVLIPPGAYSLSITHPQYEKKSSSNFEVKVERINRISRAMGALKKLQ